jgi:uncharacterized C2H2 Zn-finger protein
MRKDLDRDGVKARCPVCNQIFRSQYTHYYQMRNKGKTPTCSKECCQELLHGKSRDKRWERDQARLLKKLTRDSND